MPDWKAQIEALIAPAVEASAVTETVLIDRGAIRETGTIAASLTPSRRAILFADTAGYSAAGAPTTESLTAAGFQIETLVLPNAPLPKASVEEAQPFVEALQNAPDAFPVSVGSGVINDLVKYAAFQTERRYLSVATAASMDGYTSAGAPLAQNGFKVTIATRAPIALIADLDVIANAPSEMTGWGYGDLAGKSPAGGDWILADLVAEEPIDTVAYPMVQENLRGWLGAPDALAARDFDATARLFIGLTAVGFAMEFHGTSRPASGADHQIAHLWEMEGLECEGQKVSHGAAVAVGCALTLGLYDWLLKQDLTQLDADALIANAPPLTAHHARIDTLIPDPRIAERAKAETSAKWAGPEIHAARLARIREGWPATQTRLRTHIFRHAEMMDMLRRAGAPATPKNIGVTKDHLARTLRTAGYIRSRYTIFDFLQDTGKLDAALACVLADSETAPDKGAA